MYLIHNIAPRITGQKYELMAARYLETLDYKILDMNFHSKHGEIDIIAEHDTYVVFVEVKYRKDNKNGNPFEAVSLQKQKRIRHTAMMYLLKHQLNPQQTKCRFDVVSILDEEITLFQNAF